MNTIDSSATRRRAIPLALMSVAMLTALSADFAWGEQRGKTLQGRAYVSGGVAAAEQLKLQAERVNYKLWVITAAQRSGAYIADARIRIRDGKQQLVFDGPLDGPWLFIDLALGPYEVEASWGDQTVRSKTTIHAGDRHQIVAHFKVADEAGLPLRRPAVPASAAKD